MCLRSCGILSQGGAGVGLVTLGQAAPKWEPLWDPGGSPFPEVLAPRRLGVQEPRAPAPKDPPGLGRLHPASQAPSPPEPQPRTVDALCLP